MDLIRELSAAGFSHSEVDGLISRITPTQLVAISIGALTAFYEPWLRVSPQTASRRPLFVGLGLMVCGGLLFGVMKLVPQDFAKSLGAPACHLACGGVFLAALSWRWLGTVRSFLRMGTISYSAYLFHLPIYSRLRAAEWK